MKKRDDHSERTPRDDCSDIYTIIGSLKPWELWDEREIVVFKNPKTFENSDTHIVLPSGKEENEDLTFLETDSLVNVAPSRMSTYKSVSKMGENAAAVVQSLRHLPGDKWSWRLDMLLIQAHEQFPGNWQKIARVLKDKKDPNDWRERYETMRTINIKGHFSKEEDEILRSALNKYGKNWAIIAKKWFKGRTPKQIRDHFMNTINSDNKDNTFNKINHQYTIDDENEVNLSPMRINRNQVQIEVSSFAENKERKYESTKRIYNKAITREFVLRQQTNSSIFTDESLKEEMKGSDQSWYNHIDNNHTNQQNNGYYAKDLTKLGSNEQYKQMMSMSSNHNSQSDYNIIDEENINLNSANIWIKPLDRESGFTFISK